MSTRAAYNTFIIFQSAKLHFTSRKFNFLTSRVRIKPENFLKRRDVWQYERLSKLITKEEVLKEFSISCFLMDQRTWIGNVFSEEYINFHQSRMRRVHSLPHTVECDVERIFIHCDEYGITDIKNLLTSEKKLPIICSMQVEEETKAIFDIFFNFTARPCIDPTWGEHSLVISKYNALLKEKLKTESKQKELIQRIVATVVSTFSN